MFRIHAKQGVARGLATVGVVVAAIAASMPSASAATSAGTSGRSLAKPASLSCVWKGLIESDNGGYLSELRHNGGAPLYIFQSGTTWCLQPAVEGGYYLLPVDDNGTLCLDGGAQLDGIPAQLWACNGTVTQRWEWDGAGFISRYGIADLGLSDDGIGSEVYLSIYRDEYFKH